MPLERGAAERAPERRRLAGPQQALGRRRRADDARARREGQGVLQDRVRQRVEEARLFLVVVVVLKLRALPLVVAMTRSAGPPRPGPRGGVVLLDRRGRLAPSALIAICLWRLLAVQRRRRDAATAWRRLKVRPQVLHRAVCLRSLSRRSRRFCKI